MAALKSKVTHLSVVVGVGQVVQALFLADVGDGTPECMEGGFIICRYDLVLFGNDGDQRLHYMSALTPTGLSRGRIT